MGRLPTWSEKKTPSRVKAGSLARLGKKYIGIASLGREEANGHCDNTPSHPHPVGGKASQAVLPGSPVGASFSNFAQP